MPILNCDITNLKEMRKYENEIKIENIIRKLIVTQIIIAL